MQQPEHKVPGGHWHNGLIGLPKAKPPQGTWITPPTGQKGRFRDLFFLCFFLRCCLRASATPGKKTTITVSTRILSARSLVRSKVSSSKRVCLPSIERTVKP